MQSKSILVPVDLDKAENSIDSLQFVDGMAGEMSVQVSLLYVANLDVVLPDRRLHENLRVAWERRMEALSRQFLGDCASHCLRVRAGKPYEQIVAEAEESSSELIVLSRPQPSRRNWFRSRTAERLVRSAPCLTLILPRVWKISPEQYRGAMRPENCLIPFESSFRLS
jgi:nucleotide-binding universal stress UspA family protein